ELIGRAILDGTYPPGTQLRDADLEVAFDVSRTPVREALIRLERVGLIEMAAGRYTRVTSVTPEMIRASREHAGYQAGIVAKMAVSRMPYAAREEAVRIVDVMIGTTHDPVAGSIARADLYIHLSAHCSNVLQHHLMKEVEIAL